MNKQIEEMAKYFCHPCDFECGGGCELGHKIGECPIANETAKILYNAGYRRQEDVAREIFAEIEKLMTSLDKRHMQGGNPKQAWGIRNAMWEINELKKKYGVEEDE